MSLSNDSLQLQSKIAENFKKLFHSVQWSAYSLPIFYLTTVDVGMGHSGPAQLALNHGLEPNYLLIAFLHTWGLKESLYLFCGPSKIKEPKKNCSCPVTFDNTSAKDLRLWQTLKTLSSRYCEIFLFLFYLLFELPKFKHSFDITTHVYIHLGSF